MHQPEGYVIFVKEDHVCLFKESLYGLKQSPRQWYLRLDSFMIKHALNRCNYGCCVYFREISEEKKIYLFMYMDYMLIAYHDREEIDQLKGLLSNKFEIKDLGVAKRILGIEIIGGKMKKVMFLIQ